MINKSKPTNLINKVSTQPKRIQVSNNLSANYSFKELYWLSLLQKRTLEENEDYDIVKKD